MAEPLTHKQTAAIAALLAQPTIGDAASAARVSERTLRNWLALPAFRAAYRDAGQRLLEGAIVQLQQLASDAVATLKRNLSTGKPAVEVRAAIGILDHCAKASERWELAEQLDELQARIEAMENPAHAPPIA